MLKPLSIILGTTAGILTPAYLNNNLTACDIKIIIYIALVTVTSAIVEQLK